MMNVRSAVHVSFVAALCAMLAACAATPAPHVRRNNDRPVSGQTGSAADPVRSEPLADDAADDDSDDRPRPRIRRGNGRVIN